MAERIFRPKSKDLTKAQQRQKLEEQGYKNISYSGNDRGFYVEK